MFFNAIHDSHCLILRPCYTACTFHKYPSSLARSTRPPTGHLSRKTSEPKTIPARVLLLDLSFRSTWPRRSAVLTHQGAMKSHGCCVKVKGLDWKSISTTLDILPGDLKSFRPRVSVTDIGSRYSDNEYEYRHVQLPKAMLKAIPRDYFDSAKGTLKLLWEEEWRGLGITQV